MLLCVPDPPAAGFWEALGFWGCSGCRGSSFANPGAAAWIPQVSVEAGAVQGSLNDLVQAPISQRSALFLRVAAKRPSPTGTPSSFKDSKRQQELATSLAGFSQQLLTLSLPTRLQFLNLKVFWLHPPDITPGYFFSGAEHTQRDPVPRKTLAKPKHLFVLQASRVGSAQPRENTSLTRRDLGRVTRGQALNIP